MSEPSGFDQQLNALRALSDFNQLLHTLRTYELAAIPRGAEVFLSAGCAGTWYFDWIEQTYGRVQRHIGIEYFMPEPPGLPDYVTWIANTVADMEAVADSSVDLVFSGQNIEHLWPSDVAGFLVESFRTLKTGGLLVIDSPNRLVTRPLGWRHPQHTMEFTPQEARVLLSMSGFDVTSLRGIWMVRDPFTETLLSLDAREESPMWPFLRRIAAANVNPEHSFIWWVEARKTDARPDRTAIDRFLADIYRKEWPIRLRQTSTQAELQADGHTAFSDRPGTYLIYGPYVPLPKGRHTVTFFMRKADSQDNPGAACTCDVVESGSRTLAVAVVDRSALSVEFRPIRLSFVLSDTTFGLEFRVCLGTGGPLEVRMDFSLDSDSAYLRSV